MYHRCLEYSTWLRVAHILELDIQYTACSITYWRISQTAGDSHAAFSFLPRESIDMDSAVLGKKAVSGLLSVA